MVRVDKRFIAGIETTIVLADDALNLSILKQQEDGTAEVRC